MTNLKCPICDKDDGTQMYGVVFCKATLAKANAENEALQCAIRERDSFRRQGVADWNACCDALGWTRSFPRDSPFPSRAVIAVLERLKDAEKKATSEKARADKYSAWWEKAATEVQEARFLEVQQMARADKAERDLGECLAATNEALKDALEQGKEADAPNQALVKAVRAAYRLGADEERARIASVLKTSADSYASASTPARDYARDAIRAILARLGGAS